MRRRNTLMIVPAVLLCATAASAQWLAQGTPVVTTVGTQAQPVLVSDGTGGTIVIWFDTRDGAGDIYAQRLDSFGNTVWASGGVPVTQATDDQYDPLVVSDGAGGAIVVWSDERSGSDRDVYAARIDSAGTALWTADGVAVVDTAGNDADVVVLADGAGGALVAWTDRRAGADGNIYAQRLDAAGLTWADDGVAVCLAAGDQEKPTMVSDGAGGALIAWQDARAGGDDIYAQRLDAFGTALWDSGGVAVCVHPDVQTSPAAVSDGAGGMTVAWLDTRVASGAGVFSQRVDAAGTVLWDTLGVGLNTFPSSKTAPRVVADETGGVIAVWSDSRDDFGDIYAGRLDGAGVAWWDTTGVAVCTAGNAQLTPAAVADGAGGAVFAWHDLRAGDAVFGQRIDASGAAGFAADGVYLADGGDDLSLADDQTGAVVAVWAGVYAQRWELRFGEWGHPEPTLVSVSDVPADQGGRVRVNWMASGLDAFDYQTITRYTVWRASQSGPPYFWEQVGEQAASYFPAYTLTAPTAFDSVSGEPGVHYFRVLAHTADAFTFWVSGVDSGYSVDDLSPGAPVALYALRPEAEVSLGWQPSGEDDEDTFGYWVYRSETVGFALDPANYIATVSDTTHVDSTADAHTVYYYKVVAVDVHGNVSGPSNEVMVKAIPTGAGDAHPLPFALQLLPNHPNPFTRTTTLRIGLRDAGPVGLEVYDVAGRRVYARNWRRMPAGWNDVVFDARVAGRPIPAGVYFCRVRSTGRVQTQKMVITR